MDDSADNFGLEENILGSRNENFNFIISKMDANLDIIRFEDKIVITVTHEVLYCLAVAIWLLEGCITQATDDFEEFKEKHTMDRYRVDLSSCRISGTEHLLKKTSFHPVSYWTSSGLREN